MPLTLHFLSHPGEDTLEDHAFHRLSDEEAARLNDHLLFCDSCLDAFEEVEQFVLLMKATPPGVLSRVEVQNDTWKSLQGGAIPFRAALKNVVWGGALGVAALAMLVVSWPPDASSAVASVTLASFRGNEDALMARAPARQLLDLAIEAEDVPATGAYRIEIVNAIGRPAWNGPLTSNEGRLTASVPIRLDAGIYWVRLYAEDSELLREFGLRLQ